MKAAALFDSGRLLTVTTPKPGQPPGASIVRATPLREASTEPSELSPGVLIGDTYRVIRPLGTGAMGTVLMAHDEKLDRDVAVKLIRPNALAGHELRAQFMAEARAMARVRHPNVVAVYAYGELGQCPYFAMEYVPGTTVEQWTRARGDVLAVDEALGLLDMICRGVEAIHATGTIHGDLKSSNVLLGPSFQVKVADLGLTRSVGWREGGGRLFGGTPAYMAPELLEPAKGPRELECRQDVYALGILAFELLTGRRPFDADSLATVLNHHARTPPPPPSEVRGDLPPELDRAVLSALEKNPELRTPTPGDLRRALLEARGRVAVGAAQRIVVIDDADSSREIAAALLCAFPHTKIIRVPDGLDGLALIDAHPTALAVVDLETQRLNGLELIAALRGRRATAAVPVIAVTRAAGARAWGALAGLGVHGLLIKPIAAEPLVTLARGVLRTLSQGPSAPTLPLVATPSIQPRRHDKI